MGQLIKKFADGSFLEYDKGSFDDWCVYLTRPGIERYAPRDYQYFQRLIKYGEKYGNNKVYDDFVAIYGLTTKQIGNEILDFIEVLSENYGEDALDVEIDFTIIYLGMIAEENKERTRLGKRIKRLGIHQILMEGKTFGEAANFSRGMGWRDIDKLCKERGF